MRTLVESCFRLDTKLLKKDLQKARRNEPVEEKYLNFVDNGRSAALDYSIDHSFDGNSYLVVNIDGEPQKILLSQRELTFGTRSYLTCGCGNKTNALYLKLGYFACRRCQKLRYKSSRLNTSSEHGRFLFLQGRRLKLIEEREKITRPIYKGHYTKRFLRWLGSCSRAGIFDEAVRAWKAMEAIKSNQIQKI